tara:strand:- start:86 stop:1000 length:915 start_codon:yes stop_codon:yes gene_type:complete
MGWKFLHTGETMSDASINISITEFDKYRVQANHGPYPPYHTGLYLEDYFYDMYHPMQETMWPLRPAGKRKYIPVAWTACYNNNYTDGLQDLLDKLNPNDQYFTVSQHDDAIKERLPKDTLCFNAGGNAGGIPIPLVCSKIPNPPEHVSNEILCSFVGSITHPVRSMMYEVLKDKSDCFLYTKNWHPEVKNEEKDLFLSTASKSKFLLCPRGYGLNSFRLYEAFQLGCVPVVITDKPFLPWQDELVWSDFAIIILPQQIENMYDILKGISDQSYDKMLKTGQALYEDYFTLKGTCRQILKRLIHE